MSYFARVDENGIVVNVIAITQEVLNTGGWGPPDEWVQTSYNTRGGVHYGPDGKPDGGVALRKNYAGLGFIYDKVRDAFYPPKPFASWSLNEDTCLWVAPVPYPNDGKEYRWDEDTLSWVLMDFPGA